MKRFALPLAILTACAAFQAQAGDTPSPALQPATQAHQDAGGAPASQSAGREFKDMQKFARENEPAQAGWDGSVSVKKVGSLDVSKMSLGRAPQPAQAIEGNSRIKSVGALKTDKLSAGPRAPAAVGKAIGGHANDGDE